MDQIPETGEVAVPDGSLELGRIIAISYLDENGNTRYSVHARGDVTMLTYLGLLRAAENEVLEWGRQPE